MSSSIHQQQDQRTILFFDGVCHLCNWSVDFFLTRDKKRVILFAPLQGPTAKNTLPAEKTQALETLILLHHGFTYEKSEAVFKALEILGGFYSCAKIFKIFPRTLRDLVYQWVASNRYRWFGKRETCRLPTPDERSRFLD